MKWYEQKWFKITCYVLIGLACIGLFIGGTSSESVTEYVTLISGLFMAVLAVIAFVKSHVSDKRAEIAEKSLAEIMAKEK